MAIAVWKKKFLLVGLTCIILEITFQRATTVCEKQHLQVGFTCIILEIAFQRAAAV